MDEAAAPLVVKKKPLRPPRFAIPKSFRLLGHIIKVRQLASLVEKRGAYGLSYLSENKMELQQVKRGVHSRQHQEQTFCHELVHFILYLIGEEELCDNEQFVDRFGQALYQALTTMRY